MSTALAVWAPVVRFNDKPGPEIRYRPPRDTLDPRYSACVRHHVACDCREAELAERIAELHSLLDEDRQHQDALAAIAQLHRRASYFGGPPICEECHHGWPCPTWRLAADVSWLVQMYERLGEGPAARSEP